MLELMRERYRGTLIVAGGFDQETAEAWLRQGKADLVAFGRKFLANPDLPERFR
jgi:N-ethylmaleimide reductase